MKTPKFSRELVASSTKTKDWHIEKANQIISNSNYHMHYRKDKINYDLVNGILNQVDFEYITKPYGIAPKARVTEYMQNFPILIDNFKALEGEELKRPDNTRVFCTNTEAINETLNEKTKLMQNYIISEIKRVRMEEAIKANPEIANSPEAMDELEQSVMSPEEIEKHMKSYKDSYEQLGNELLNYFKHSLNLKEKFRKAWKHGLTSAKEFYTCPIINGEPQLLVVNPLYFDYDKDPDLDFIHEGEWAVATYRMSPSSIVSTYHDYLTDDEIEQIYRYKTNRGTTKQVESGWEIDLVDFGDYRVNNNDNFAKNSDELYNSYIFVKHAVWRSWYKVGYLTFLDENDIEQVIQVPESYKLNKDQGDLKIEWEWLPEIREVTKIGEDYWVKYGVVEEIPKDPDNPYDCPLPYTGVVHNSLNSLPTSPVDLWKPYQYFYNIIHRKLQEELASDKGQKLLANINQVPTSMGFDLGKWQHYMDVDGIIWVNPNEEGNRGGADLNSWKNIDLTTARAIDQKIQLLEYIEKKCQEVIGINQARMGQQDNRELVGTTQQQIVQSSNTTEPWFATHEMGKKAALQMLLNTAKIAYHKYPNKKLVYILSDMSKKIIELDTEKLACAAFGIFVSNASEDLQMYQELKQLAHAALQTQSATLSSLAKMVRGNVSPGELIEFLEEGEARVQQIAQENAQADRDLQKQIADKQAELKMLEMELEKYKIDKEAETDIRVNEIRSFAFQKDQDVDDNGVPDQLEVDRLRLDGEGMYKDIELRQRELDLKSKEIDKKFEAEKLKAETAIKVARENKNAAELKKKQTKAKTKK